ncbi:hypothetical protein GUJ93_ZPchr0007g6263 [Zizania palustris]|uniref:DUF6821 domain-containing protein n=1 Tax=Zizania palustris TaxID=103762 RepID=A0A8J5TF33_ZIZPA|nr:hypothetical protein GUJ93_ZPchr0007g6263 [Zizania palustris]
MPDGLSSGKKRGATVGGDNPEGSRKHEERYSPGERPRPTKADVPFRRYLRAPGQGSLEAPKQTEGALGQTPGGMPEASLRQVRRLQGATEDQEATWSMWSRDMIVIACAMSGDRCNAGLQQLLVMEKGDVSMDAASQDMWDWELLSDHMSSSFMESKAAAHGGHGRSVLGDQETDEPNPRPLEEASADMAVDECKDIGVVPEETKPRQEEPIMAPEATELPASGGEEDEAFQSSDAKGFDDVGEEAAPGRVGKLRVNGIGALCSFGFAAATVCIFLVGGKMQHHHKQQQQKMQLEFCGDDKRMQQVVQQTSRLNRQCHL